MLKNSLLILFFLSSVISGYCQQGFLIDKNRRSAKVKFELVNNLIILPVELNGVELSFLLDTGVNTSVLLNIEEGDSLELKNAEKINLRGLGGEELIEAYRSVDNELRLGKVSCKDLTLFLIYDADVNFSPRLGIPVHGIIGYDFFKDFVVEINYFRRFLRLHDPDRFSKKLSRYNEMTIRFFQNKPYIRANVEIEGKVVPVTLLIDNGLGDAVWLFNENADIKVPEKSFEDFLGLGLLGDVTGKRSRIGYLELGDHRLRDVTAAFPDSVSVQGLKLFAERNGSIGGEVLKRFNVIFDYGHQKIYLRKNRFFNDPFNYDMSGITLEHSGFMIVESYVNVSRPESARDDNEIIFETGLQTRKKFELKPAFKIVSVRKDSPAYEAGLQAGDELVKINGREVFRYDLEDIVSLFASEEGKLIRLEVNRGISNLKFEFRLKKVL
ncbi:aspartyl protease family protein [Salinimicrobium catena]|uniref:aspartyl protease family protein n=1 Tax=Salinimicrobium catena TaxID=390640 RepID=UPI002FE46663